MTVCGTCRPPDPDSLEGEAIARFRDFLATAGPPAHPDEPGRPRSPAERYRLRFLAWRTGPDALALAERMAAR